MVQLEVSKFRVDARVCGQVESGTGLVLQQT